MDTDRLDPDLTEALARGREPRKMWPVLHAVEGTAERPPGWWESWPGCAQDPEQHHLCRRRSESG